MWHAERRCSNHSRIRAARQCGRTICIGSGCYDWYGKGVDASADYYHYNVEQMTLNAINYLCKIKVISNNYEKYDLTYSNHHDCWPQ